MFACLYICFVEVSFVTYLIVAVVLGSHIWYIAGKIHRLQRFPYFVVYMCSRIWLHWLWGKNSPSQSIKMNCLLVICFQWIYFYRKGNMNASTLYPKPEFEDFSAKRLKHENTESFVRRIHIRKQPCIKATAIEVLHKSSMLDFFCSNFCVDKN